MNLLMFDMAKMPFIQCFFSWSRPGSQILSSWWWCGFITEQRPKIMITILPHDSNYANNNHNDDNYYDDSDNHDNHNAMTINIIPPHVTCGFISERWLHYNNDHHNYYAMKIIILPHLRFYNWAETDVSAKEGEEARGVGWNHWGAKPAEC